MKVLESISPSVRAFTFTALYAAILFLILPYHEVWRDEMHDLSMIMDFKSPIDLYKNTTTHGFPALWYLILWTGYFLTHSVLVLKIFSIAFVSAAIYLFLRYAPFSGFEKFLFPLGYFPLYEYSLISRSYGLSMMLLFAICILYVKRFKDIFPLAIAAFLLANTNAPSLILTIALLIVLIVQSYANRSLIENTDIWLLGLIVIAGGIILAVFQIIPDPHSVVKYYVWTPQHFLQAIAFAFSHPGLLFSRAFGFHPEFLSVSLWLFYLGIMRRYSTGLFFFLSAIGLGLFFLLFHPGAIRHQGFLYLALVAVLWMERIDHILLKPKNVARGGEEADIIEPLREDKFIPRYRKAFFLVVLVMQAVMGYLAVSTEITLPYSSSADFAAFLRRDPQLQDAILVPEPDYLAESLPFYTNHAIYLTRENRFGKYVHFTTANAQEVSLGALLDVARKLQQEKGKPVLLMIGHPLYKQGPFAYSFSYSKIFRYSPQELVRLEKETVFLTEFRGAITDENYKIFAFKENPSPVV